MAVARRRDDVEIVCVDSMTVYRGMDIGTAKPPAADRAAVAHHVVDVVDPSEEFTVRQFQEATRAARAAIDGRGHRALLVGGTGLYLRAVVDAFEIPARYPDVASELEREADEPGGLAVLHDRLACLDPVAAARTTASNRRRIVRALEVTVGSGRPFSSYGPGLTAYPQTDVTLVGLPFTPDVVDRRIEERFSTWLDEGLVEEVRRLARRPEGMSRTARQALGYKELLSHVLEGAPLDACVEEAVRRTRAYARRQWSWFRRDPRVCWIHDGDDPVQVLTAALDGVLVHGGRARGAKLCAMDHATERREVRGTLPGADEGTFGCAPLTAVKLEAAGNDFLVVLDAVGSRGEGSRGGGSRGGGRSPVTPAQVRALCDRRRGVGADGVIVGRLGVPDADLSMELWNADGSPAEMSGNGIRCLVHAAVLAGIVRPGRVRVSTAAGVRTVDYVEAAGAGPSASASVDMGPVLLGDELASPLPGTRARTARVGNPHLVLLGDVDLTKVDMAALGRSAEASTGAPVNVEVVRPGRTGADLTLRVFERGVGETEACGTGSCAAAAVARSFGVVGRRVLVDNPGGRLEVHLGAGGDDPVLLGGPVRKIADVLVAPAVLGGSR